MATKIQVRRDTEANWTANNPILANGEIGFATDGNYIKVGNGSSTWSALPKSITSSSSGLITSSMIVDGTITGTDIASETITSSNILNGTIVNADINASAAIAPSKISGTAVITTDSRLSDARTPTAHASSHGPSGSDAITIAQSQVTNLSTDLASKASLSGATFTGTLNAPYEPIVAGTVSTNVLTHDIVNGNVVTAGSLSANFTLNITGLSTTDNQATTVSIIVTQGATGYIPSALQIGGSVQTIKWQGGSAPTPTSSSGKIDIFSFTITRISSTWTVYGSMVGNF